MFIKHNSFGKVSTYFNSPESSTNIPLEAKKLTDALEKYPGTKAYEALQNGKDESITPTNIDDKKLLLTAVQYNLKEGAKDPKFLQLNILMLQLQGAITQYEGNLFTTKINSIKSGLSDSKAIGGLNINNSSPTVDSNGNFSQPIDSDKKFNFSDLQLNNLQDRQSTEIQAIDQNYENSKSKLVTAHTKEMRSEYIGTNAYKALKSWKFENITPLNIEKAKELLIASQNRLNSIDQDNTGYQDMLSQTNKLRQKIFKLELKQTADLLNDFRKWLI